MAFHNKIKTKTIDLLSKPSKEDNREFVKDFLNLLYDNTNIGILNNLKATDQIPASMDMYVEKYTGFRRDEINGVPVEGSASKKLLTDGTKEDFLRIKNIAEQELLMVAGMGLNPKVVTDELESGRELSTMYGNIYHMVKRGDAGFLGLGKFLGEETLANYFGNKRFFMRQNARVANVDMSAETIDTRVNNYIYQSGEMYKNISSFFVEPGLISRDELNKYVKYFDGRMEGGIDDLKTILHDKHGDSYIDENNTIAAKDKAFEQIKAYHSELMKFNYGDTPEKAMEAAGDSPNSYYTNNRVMYTAPDGSQVPCYLSFVYGVGKGLTDIILDKGRQGKLISVTGANNISDAIRTIFSNTNKYIKDEKLLHDSELYVLDKFLLGNFKPSFKGYTPASTEDPMLSLIGADNAKFNGLFGRVGFFEHAKGVSKDPDSDVYEAWLSSTQAFHTMATRISDYSAQKAKLDIIEDYGVRDEEKFAKFNPTAYDIIKHDAQRRVNKYEDQFDNKKQISSRVASLKRLASSFVGLVGTSILATAGMVNIGAGAMGLSLRFGVKNVADMVGQYKNDLGKDGIDGDVASAIKEFTKWDAPVTGKSESLVANYGSINDDKINWVMNAVSEKIGALNKWNTDGAFLKLIPFVRNILPKYLSFNATEERLSSYSNCLLHDRVKGHIKSLLSNGVITTDDVKNRSDAYRNHIRKTIDDYKDLAFYDTKSAIGDFSNSAKPAWATETMRDATSIVGVIGGTIATMGYMFKQVEFINSGLINRTMSALGIGTGKNVFSPKRLLANLSTDTKTASVGGAMMMMLLAAYNELGERDEDIPRIQYLQSLDVTQMPRTVANSVIGATAKFLFNIPMSERQTKANADLLNWFAGVGLSGVSRSVLGEDNVIKDILTPVDDNIVNIMMDIPDLTVDSKSFKTRMMTELGSYAKYPMIGPLLSHSNDNLKVLTNLAINAKSAYNAIMLDDEVESAKEWTNVGKNISKSLDRLTSSSVWFPRSHWEKIYSNKRDTDDYDRLDWNKKYYSGYNKNMYTITDNLLTSLSRGYKFKLNNYVKNNVMRGISNASKVQ